MKSESIAELAKALALAQLQMATAKKDSVNPFFKSKYADLASVSEACRSALGNNGLSVAQLITGTHDAPMLITLLMHNSGEYLSSDAPLLLAKKDAQGLGSAITYQRRYSLAAMVGVIQDDDDGNAASHQEKPKAPPSAIVYDYFDSHESLPPDATPGWNEKVLGQKCELCNSEMRLTKNGKNLYCPNFKDASKGKHSYIEIGLGGL